MPETSEKVEIEQEQIEASPSAAVETPAVVESSHVGAADSGTAAPDGAGEKSGTSDSSTGESPAPEIAKVESKAAEPKVDWRDRRISQLTARLKELQEAREKEPTSPGEEEAAGIESRIEAEAQKRLEQREFASRCNTVVERGRTQYGEAEFNSRLAQLRNVVDVTDPNAVAAYENFIRAGLETENLDKIIFDLAGDPNEAVKVLSMPPMKMAVELARRASAPEPEGVSSAPKPIRPVGSAGNKSHVAVAASDPSAADRLSTAEWMKRREAEVEAKRKRA